MSRRFLVQLCDQEYEYEEEAGTTSTGALTYSTVSWLEPMYESHVANGEIGELRCLASRHPEDALPLIPLHRGIRLIDTENDDEVVFDGVIVKQHLVIGGEREQTQIVAYNHGDYLLDRINLHGQLRLSYAGEVEYFTSGFTDVREMGDNDVQRIDTPLIFNPDGEPNMLARQVRWSADATLGVNQGHLWNFFDAPSRVQVNSDGTSIASIPWHLSNALTYLFNTTNAWWALDPSSYGDSPLSIFVTNGDPLISNVNLEGKSLLDALRTLLVPHNYGFTISPTLNENGKHEISFYFRGNPETTKAVYLEERGTSSMESAANLIFADFSFDGTPVVNNLLAVGDRISVTTLAHTNPPAPAGGKPPVMTLVPGWKLTDLDWGTVSSGKVNPYQPTFRSKYCNERLMTKVGTGDEAKYVFGIGRLWLVNQGQNPNYDLEDLTTDLGGPNSVDLRRFEQPELYDRNVEGALLQQEDIVVELSFDGGGNWRVCERSWYRVLPSGMGIVFTNINQLELLGYKWVNNIVPSGTNYWQGLYDAYYANTNGLQIRVLCSVKSDERVKSENPNDGSVLPLAVEREFENTGYKKVTYNDQAFDAVFYVDFQPAKNLRDDTSALGELASVQLSNSNRLLVSGQFAVLLDDVGEYQPGYAISGITNRIDFTFKPTVLRVIYDFPSQHVHVVVDNRLIKTVLKAARVLEGDQREHHFGIDEIVPLGPGQGHKVPFIPGRDSSQREHFMRKAAGEEQ